jgi:hypothetical protein
MGRSNVPKSLLGFVLLSAIWWGACEKHDPDSFSPTAPGVFNTLILAPEKTSIPADGSSTTDIVARVNPEAAAGRRLVEFTTSTGTFVGASASTPTQVSAEAVRGEARITLKSSSKVETATIEAKIKDGTTTLVTAHAQVRFETPGPSAIQLVASRSSAPADGFSRTDLIATLNPDSPSDRRTVIFSATKGTLVNGTGAPSTIEVVADRNNRARAEIISSKSLETSIVTASIKDVPGASDSITVRFDPPNPSQIVRISTSRAEAPADNETVMQVFAEVAPDLPEGERTVSFTTTAGSFVGASNPNATTAKADASNRATVDLKADSRVAIAVLRATASVATAETTVSFFRALPESVIVDLGTVSTIKANGTDTVSVTAELRRDVGSVTNGTVVEFSAVNPSTGAEVALLFRQVKPSEGGNATALLIAPTTAPRIVVTVRAKVRLTDGTFIVGGENITIID